MLVAETPLHNYQQYSYPSNIDLDLDPDLDLDLDFDLDLNLDLGIGHGNHSIASSFQSISSENFAPTASAAIPRTIQQGQQHQQSAFGGLSMIPAADLMQPNSWLGTYTPRSGGGRGVHQRDSSQSSLGSTGPASPYSHNTANPQIALTTDSAGETYQNLPYYDDSSYQLAKSLNPTNHDAFYANQAGYVPDTTAAAAYSSLLAAAHKKNNDRGLLPPPELSIGSNRSRPVSVASSIASDSPATPSLDQPDDERRRKSVLNNVPKLDRTMTDVYNDELYSPNFTLTSASPSQASQMALSPSHDMFAQRLHAINNQHLSAAHSPVARERSPFRHGSPLAPTDGRDFTAPGLGSSHMRFGSAQRMREQRRAEQDVQALRHQVVRHSDTASPQTISPKDAMLEFREAEGEANFPLFPPHSASEFNDMAKPVAQPFDNMPLESSQYDSYLASHLPNGIQVPPQYPFIPHGRQRSGSTSMAIPTRMRSAGTSPTDVNDATQLGRAVPDGGTYSCTYHGCTFRFDTPALLQKHKREGHRQAHGLTATRRPENNLVSTLNSQAGPHRCDRINPSTGKSCNTVFSRPYDLTRHEDTIHNARKQKVRCNLCTEEKTFSRADALTRHYRVCHPDIEFPGKHRRRGAHTT